MLRRVLSYTLLLVALLFIAGSPAFASNSCQDVFSSSAQSLSIAQRAARLAKKLEVFEKPQTEFNEQRTLKPFLKKLKTFGSSLDYDIAETIVACIEAAGSGYRSKPSSAMSTAQRRTSRPESQSFRDDYWNIHFLGNYFFASPATFTFSKRRDLVYLQHVLKTAKLSRRGAGLNAVVLDANRSWHLTRLQKEVPLYRDYLAWENSLSRESLHARFIKSINEWVELASTPAELAARRKYTLYTVDSLPNTWSNFDVYLLEKYFEAVRASQLVIDPLKMVTEREWQMTDWRVVESGLATGSLDYAKDFLDHVSHDTDRKIVLLKVLNEMSLRREHAFGVNYLRAFEQVASRLARVPAPEHLQSDLHVFSVVGDIGFTGDDAYTPVGLVFNPQAAHVLTSWNEYLGRLESTVVKTVALVDANATLVSAFAELQPLVQHYFASLRKQNATVTEEQVAIQESREMKAKMTRTTFFIATEKGKFSAESLLAMSRIFYGGARYLGATPEPRPIRVGGEKTFIEEDFPQLVLPERSTNQAVFELGRLLGTEKAAANTRVGMVRFMADHLLSTGGRGTAYMDGGKGATKLYQAMGAKIVATPEQLNLPVGYKPVWVLGVSLDQMTRDFAMGEFKSIQLRPNAK